MAGTPAITRNQFEKGYAYYVACRTNQDDIEFLYREMLDRAEISYSKLPAGIEKHTRFANDIRYDFYLNCTDKPVCISKINGFELISCTSVDGKLHLDKYGVAVIKN
jgi:beta-galactosidase